MCEEVKDQKSVCPRAWSWGGTVRDKHVPSVKVCSVWGSLWWWHTAMVRLPFLPSVAVEISGGNRGFGDTAEHVSGEECNVYWEKTASF